MSHLILDGAMSRDVTPGELHEWLLVAPGRIGMHRISPAIVEFRESVLMGMCLLAESHIAVHLDMRQMFAFAEFFTCRAFDPIGRVTAEALVRELGITPRQPELIVRGLETLREAVASVC